MAKIIVSATVASVRTLADGGLRVTLDLPESAILQAAGLMEHKRNGIVLVVSLEAYEEWRRTDDKSNDE